LIEGIRLADLAHGETDVDQDPVTRHGTIVCEETEVNSSPHPDDVDKR
jgi:hypothetical protein